MNYEHLLQADPELYASMERELGRQRDHLELIASENFTSPAVMEAVGSHLTNKYAEGYPGARYYGGCDYVDEVERLAIDRVTRLFGADHANVQPHSGSQANMAVYAALLQPGDRILGMNLSHGGHLTHGSKASLSGKYFEAHFYGVDPETETIDYDALARVAEEVRPKLIIAGASAYPRVIDFARFRAVADSVGAYLMVDMAHIAGLVAGGPDEWSDYSYGVYVDLDKLKTQLKQVFKKKPIPGQPTNKKGKPYNYFVYEEATVNVDDMDHVIEVQKAISNMGYEANSQMEWLEQSKQQSNMIQAALGGIGAVSLLVAAIGIANTMMMSIYERTKEIGVLKVLGCSLATIRNMFLIEAGFIGFMGGLIGLTLSFMVSVLINQFLAATFLYGMDGKLSVIPIWLAVPSVGFAIIIGMAAGFFPAMRAMKLSPLAAIRNE